jgi:HPt (histidine-containing phosphotransfer) domain-containing protein
VPNRENAQGEGAGLFTEREQMNLKELGESLGLDEEEYLEMIDLFFESGGADLKKIEAAVSDGDAARGYAASHSLKGSAGSLGLMMIYEKTVLIDDKLRRGDLDGVAEMVISLRREYDWLVAETEKTT